MTSNGDFDENNKNLDNLNPRSGEVPMEVDKPDITSIVEESVAPPPPKEKEEDPRIVHERKSKQFVKELYKFHENAGTPIVRHPKINGKDIDLYELYTEMTKLGGWVKVNQRNDWDELLDNLDFPKSCVNAAVAIKYIYIRYLDRYEKLHFLGEEVERVDEDDEDVRQKKLNTRYLHNVPMTYNHAQHHVSESNRLAHKLSTDYYKPTQNEKLFLSLLSPLPNEQNFALNVCMLISNEPVATLIHLDKCPKLIDALLAHAGVYSHYSLREVFTEFYSNYRRHSLQTFWNDCLSDKPHILELAFGDISESLDGEIVSIDDKESEGAQEAAQHEVVSSFLNLKRGFGTQDYIGLRVQQIATILRNLSFVEENSFLFAHSRTFLRFLVMCSNIRWNNLHHMALDMLGNIAEDIELADPVTDDLTRCLLATIMDGLESEDRGVIISCMEVLYKLCRRSNNEDYLYKAFDKAMYRKITSFLWLKDAMLVMYTLECMYALTNMGERTCNGFVHVRGIIDSLVSLVTLEAKTFGQEGCILMCVVDKMHGAVATTKPVPASGNPVANTPAVTNSPQKAVVPPTPKPSTMATPQSNVVTPQKVHARPQNPSSATKTPLTSKQSQQQAHQENEHNAHEWLRTSYELGDVAVDRVEMQELYKLYVTSMSKLKRGGVVSPAFFPKVVKAVFGTTTGPIKDQGTPFYSALRVKKVTTTESVPQSSVTKPPVPQSTRIVTIPTNKPSFTMTPTQTAASPKPNTVIQQVTPDGTHVITTVAAAQAAAAAASKQPNTTHSVSAPVTAPNATTTITAPSIVATSTGSMTVTPVMVPVTGSTTPQQQQIIRQQQHPSVTVVASSGGGQQQQSSLIKSLLANKVTQAPTVVMGQSPVKTMVANVHPNQPPQFVGGGGVQDQKKTQFYINPTNTNQPPPGAVAAASVIMSSVAAAQQSGKPTATVPIGSNNKFLQSSPTKTVIGVVSGGGNNHPPLVLTTSPTGSGTNNPPKVIASNAMTVRQVAQRQQLQKQKELAQRNLQSTAFKQGMVTTMVTNQVMDPNQPPPLAPLSGGSSQKVTVLKMHSVGQSGGTPVIISAPNAQQTMLINKQPMPEDNISLANQLDGMTPPLGGGEDEDDSDSKQKKVTANKMLADLLEKKSDPPTFGETSGGNGGGGQATSTTVKRKISVGQGGGGPSKRKSSEEQAKATPSAANLYAEMAASILEDEDSIEADVDEDTEEDISMEEEKVVQAPMTVSIKATPGKTIIVPTRPQQQQVINLPMRQQMIMSPNTSHQQQVILASPHATSGQTATATIKTESGYQTVPIIVQHNQQHASGTVQASVAAGPSGTSIIQRPATTAVHAGQTQYVLATNPQGQTYVVATQAPVPQQMQTLLVTQTPQQQGTQQKTIIILQQQPSQGGAGSAGQSTATPIQQAINSQGQKIIMTTSQGQQVMMTGTGTATAVGGGPSNQGGQRQIVIQAQSHQGQHATGSNIIVQSGTASGAQMQKQIILTGAPGTATGIVQQQQQHYTVKPPAPMDAISSVENIPQHIIKTSTGLQIKPVHLAAQSSNASSVAQSKGTPQQQSVTTTPGGPIIQSAVPPPQPKLPPASNPVQTPPVQPSLPTTTASVVVVNPPVSTMQGVVTQTTSTPAPVAVPTQQIPMAVSTPVMSSASSASSSPVPQSSPKITTGLSTVVTSDGTITVTTTTTPAQPPAAATSTPNGDNGVDINWPYVCDWRGCPRRKFKSAEEVFYHACKAHCPDTLDFDAEIFCQWGLGPTLCDSKPRKRFSLMTHFQDRHCTEDKLLAAVQRRLERGIATSNLTHPITIIRDVTKDAETAVAGATPTGKKDGEDAAGSAKKASKPGTWQPTAEAVSIIKRREFKDNEFTKAWKDDNEGPVSISIRLTASLILRNLVTYSDMAKRMLKSHETHLAQVALSNVESSRTIAQILYEMNDIHPV